MPAVMPAAFEAVDDYLPVAGTQIGERPATGGFQQEFGEFHRRKVAAGQAEQP